MKSKFAAKWEKEFDKSFTQKGRFGAEKTGFYEVDFMKRVDKETKYADVGDFECVSLPFLDSDCEMLFFKPKAGRDLTYFDESVYKQAVKRVRYASSEVALAIPKFKINSSLNFIEPLKELGVNSAFNYSNDFKIFKEALPLAIEKFSSKTEVEIDEKGATAISLVVIEMRYLSADSKPEPVSFTLDKPFIYLIYNRETSQVLYIGQIVKF